MDVILIGTNGSSYTITDATRTIALTGIPSITTENLLYVYNVTQDKLYYSPTETLAKASVSGGNIITISTDFAVMTSTDVLHIQLSTGDLAYDSTLDVFKTTTQNPDYAYRTSPEILVSLSNPATATYYYLIPWDTYKHGSLTVFGTAGASDTMTYKLWATNMFDADLITFDTTTEWVDVTNDLTGAASYTIANTTAKYQHWLDSNITVEYLLFEVDVTYDTTITLDVYLKKGY